MKNERNSNKYLNVAITTSLLLTLNACDTSTLNKADSTEVPFIPLNDTGVTFFIDDTNSNGKPLIYTSTPDKFPNSQTINSTSEPSNFPGQDGTYGRDTQEFNDFNGNAGFSLTKLDKVSGAVLNDDAVTYGCVADNVTGLTWEHKIKTSDLENELHAAHAKYTWYDPNPSTNGGDSGLADTSLCQDAAVVGNTLEFIQDVNQEKLCGFDDWRLPTVEEIRSIIDYQADASETNLMLDPNFFPYAALTAHRWTSQSLGTDSTIAFGFHMHDGFVQYHTKYCTSGQSNYHNGIMLVRGPN